jgi:hypothetical protein
MKKSIGLSVAALSAIFAMGCSASDGSKSGDGQGPGAGGGGGATSSSGGAGGAGGGGVTPPAGDMARIRVVHASPDAPAVDVYAVGVAQPLFKGLSYGDTSASLDVPAGAYSIELRASPSTASDLPVFSAGPFDLKKGSIQMVAAVGLAASKTAGDKLRLLAFDEAPAPVGLGKTRVRLVHASPDAPTVGIDVGNDDPMKPELASLARFADQGGVELPSDADLQVGIDADGARVTAFSLPKLPNGQALTVFATGLVAKLPREQAAFALLVVGPSGTIGFLKQNPFLYALHAGVDAPAVDVCAGGGKVIDDLAFGKLAGPLQVPAGDLVLELHAHVDGASCPAGAPAASAKLTGLLAGERYLGIATGYLAPAANQPSFGVLAFADGFAADAAATRARVIHASPNAPTVDVGPLAGGTVTPAVRALAFGKASDATGLALPPPMLDVGITPADANTTIVGNYGVPTPAGTRAFVVAAGALGHSTRPLRLAIIDTAPTPWTVSHVFTR